MDPYPVGNSDIIAVAQGVNDGCDPAQVVAPGCETVPPAIPAWRCFDHRGPVGVVGVRPLFAQFTKLNDATAMVVVGHPARYLISGESGNIHDINVGGAGDTNGSRRFRSDSENYITPISAVAEHRRVIVGREGEPTDEVVFGLGCGPSWLYLLASVVAGPVLLTVTRIDGLSVVSVVCAVGVTPSTYGSVNADI